MPRSHRLALPRLVAIVLAVLTACGGDDDGGTRPQPTPTNTLVASPTPTHTAPSSPTSSATATRTASPTPPPPDTATPSPTATFSVAPSATPTATPTETLPGSPSPTPTQTAAPSCDDPEVREAEPLCELDYAPYTCEFLIPEKCLLPYPSTVFLREDPATRTGLRVAYPREAMPANKDGLHIDPTEWNTLDGFSPGPVIEAFFPQGVDLDASRVPTADNVARSLEADSPTVLFDAQFGRRIPHFTELDAQASGPGSQMLLIRPATRLRNEGFYIVAIRGLVDREGNPIPPPRPFQILRDGLATPVRTINERRAPGRGYSRRAGGGRHRARRSASWPGTSSPPARSRSRRALLRCATRAWRRTARARRLSRSPSRGRRQRGYLPPRARDVHRAALHDQPDAAGAPQPRRERRAAAEPHRPGAVPRQHSARRRRRGQRACRAPDRLRARAARQRRRDKRRPPAGLSPIEYNFVVGATDWIGMSEEDVPVILGFIPDLSGFPVLPDRLQQAMLNFILLGRLMTAPDGLVIRPGLPARRRAAHRHRGALLLRHQPGRDRRRRAHGAHPRHPARRARRRRRELQPAAAALDRVRSVPEPARAVRIPTSWTDSSSSGSSSSSGTAPTRRATCRI